MDTSTSELARYRDQTPMGAAIGYLGWYSVSDLHVPHEDVKSRLATHGIAMPTSKPNDADVFRRVTTHAQRRNVAAGANGIVKHYMIRQVSASSDDEIRRRLVVETRNAAGKRLDYAQTRDFTFDRGTGRISVSDAGVYEVDPMIEDITRDILTTFEATKGTLDSNAIRELIRRVMVRNGATMVREGVYFLGIERAGVLDGLTEFTDTMGPAVSFHTLPLVDDAKQRKMIKQAFEDESIGAIDSVMGEISTIRRGGEPISEKRYHGLLTRYQELVKRAKQYEGILSDGLTGTHDRLDIFQRQIVALLDQVQH